MALTRLQLGELYFGKGGTLERRFLGAVLYMSQQVKGGGVENPTAAQTAWANACIGADLAAHGAEARKAMEWGMVNNTNLQDQGNSLPDEDIDWIVKEYALTYPVA